MTKNRMLLKKEDIESEKDSTFQGADVIIDITPQMGKAFLGYAQDCAQAFDNRVGTIDDIVIFRNNMRYICNGDRKELLMRIMIGDFDKIFSKK